MLLVSNGASTELKRIFADEVNNNKNLILYFTGSGCTGPSLGIALEEKADSLQKIEHNGIAAYIDGQLNEYLAKIGDIKIDYITEGEGGGYTVKVGDLSCNKDGCDCS